MTIPILSTASLDFPDVAQAIAERDGLVAVGGDLTPERLLAAYRQGIFPWYREGEPIAWWALSPRMVLLPETLHIPRSLAKKIRNSSYLVTVNRAFDAVISACAECQRPGQDGTWITSDMREAYQMLHRAGYAHSFEYWYSDGSGSLKLGGGLYGVQIGQVFFGESMFAHVSDASKIAFVYAVHFLQECGVRLIDCQMYTEHLARFGAEEVPFAVFQAALDHLCHQTLGQTIISKVIFEGFKQ